MQSNSLNLLADNTAVTDAQLTAAIRGGNVPTAPLSTLTAQAQPKLISTDFFKSSSISSTEFNSFFLAAANDLVRLFAAANDNDTKLSALQSLGVTELTKIAAQLDSLESQIQAIRDLQFGYLQGYTIFNRTDFIDSSSIEDDPAIIGGLTVTSYDPKLQAITLQVSSDYDTLHASDGNTTASPSIDLQFGYPVKAYESFRTAIQAIDASSNSYWAEVVLSDELVEIPWPPANSPYCPALYNGLKEITAGAVCEYTLTYRQPTSWNQLVIKPFCELPINLAAIFVVKRDMKTTRPSEYKLASVQNGYSHYLITEYNSQRNNGMLFLNQTERLFFPLQEEVLSITLIFHQPHYTREIFNLPVTANYENSLWQQMLGNTPLLGLPQSIVSQDSSPNLSLAFNDPQQLVSQLGQAIGVNLSGSFTQSNAAEHTYTKYQYVYGAYDIDIHDRRFVQSSQFVSQPLSSNLNLAQGSLVADYELPLVQTTIGPATAWVGLPSLRPSSFEVPAATISFDLLVGSSTQPWYPVAPLDAKLVHEPVILTEQTQTTQLRLQAQPDTPVLLSNFDGQGNVTTFAGVLAPPVVDDTPTLITWPNTILNAPGYYIVSYTPMDTSHWVNFGLLAENAGTANQKTATFTGTEIDQLRGLQLPSVPYIDSDRIAPGFDPNGDGNSEYVPISIKIDNLPIIFPNMVDNNGHAVTVSSFSQDNNHKLDIHVSTQVELEPLYSTDSNPSAAQNFQAKYSNWDVRPGHLPQLFLLVPNQVPAIISQYDQFGNSIWDYEASTGIIRFVNGNAAVSGQIGITYWYYSPAFTNPPQIINRTNYGSNIDPVLTPFDPITYPVLEYVQLDDKIYFNVSIPADAVISVSYFRLFDQIRVRANFTRVDPINDSATAHLYGYTFLARDANGTSSPVLEYPEVVWGDLELYSLGTTTQTNPGIGLIQGDSTSSGGLPPYTEFHWYRIVNSGSIKDLLRTNYDASNGTTVFWDWNGDRYIESDGGISKELTYRIMNVDGSNTIPVEAGGSVVIGIANFLVPPGTPASLHPATIYSGFSANFLESSNWLLTSKEVTKETSIASVVIN